MAWNSGNSYYSKKHCIREKYIQYDIYTDKHTHTHTHTRKEIYYKELAHPIMEAEKSQDLSQQVESHESQYIILA